MFIFHWNEITYSQRKLNIEIEFIKQVLFDNTLQI